MKYSLKNATPADKTWLENLRKECYKDLFDATWGQWDEARHQRHFLASWNEGNIQIIESENKAVGMLQALMLTVLSKSLKYKSRPNINAKDWAVL